jgi:hypothetical protein
MPLSYVLDEHLRGPLWRLFLLHNRRGRDVVDVTRVGDPADLPLGTRDPALLLWAEREGRILVTRDSKTMPGHFADHLAAAHHSPGVMMLKPFASLREVAEWLIVAAHASEPHEWVDQITYIP